MENPNGHKYSKEKTDKEYVQDICEKLNKWYEADLKVCNVYLDITPDTQSADCCLYDKDTHAQLIFHSESIYSMWDFIKGMNFMRHTIVNSLTIK